MNAPKPLPSDPPTTDRLRADIDAGRTGEKVRHPDPAAAPLGSDEEAGGNPPTEEERRREAEARPLGPAPKREEPGPLFIYGLATVVIALAILAVFAFLRM